MKFRDPQVKHVLLDAGPERENNKMERLHGEADLICHIKSLY